MSNIEIFTKLLVTSLCKSKLGHIIPTVISKIDDTSWRHLISQFLHDLRIFFRANRTENKQNQTEISLKRLEWDWIIDEITLNCIYHSLGEQLVLLQKLYCCFANVTCIDFDPVQTKNFQNWVEAISNTASIIQESKWLFRLGLKLFSELGELCMNVVSVLVKISRIVFVKHVPVQSLVVFKFCYLFFRKWLFILFDYFLSLLCHFIVPAV